MFWRKKEFTYEEQRAYVIQTIRDFLEGTGGAWDWDDFTSVPTGYPELDAVRGFCLGLRRLSANRTDRLVQSGWSSRTET